MTLGKWVRVTSTIGWPPFQGWLQSKRVGEHTIFFVVDRDRSCASPWMSPDWGRTFYLSGAARVALAPKPAHRKEPPPPVRSA